MLNFDAGRSGTVFMAGSLVAAFALGACGAPLEGAGTSSTSAKGTTTTASAPAPTSPLPGELAADSICGQGWKWNGVHCVATSFTGETNSGSASTASNEGPDGRTHTRDPSVAAGPHVTIEDVKVGAGAEAHENSHVRIHYVGKLTDGSTFDSSRDRNAPFSFTIGVGEVIRGFDQGVTGMKVGGVRHVTIPPVLGYGRRGAPPKIPPDATLTFDIELLGVE